jgi:selenocysteine lyase/cysteine desulfurase
MGKIGSYENYLAKFLYNELKKIPGVNLYGPSFENAHRAPTVSFTIDGIEPSNVCQLLGEKGICVWDGHFYAIRAIEVLGLLEKGGLVRAGISLYASKDDVQRLVSGIKEIVKGKSK